MKLLSSRSPTASVIVYPLVNLNIVLLISVLVFSDRADHFLLLITHSSLVF